MNFKDDEQVEKEKLMKYLHYLLSLPQETPHRSKISLFGLKR
jgi:hypothetical protein